jgi:hypothetical protein
VRIFLPGVFLEVLLAHDGVLERRRHAPFVVYIHRYCKYVLYDVCIYIMSYTDMHARMHVHIRTYIHDIRI